MHMKMEQFFRPIFREAWLLTKTHKAWWVIGLLALFLMGAVGYQAVFQGIRSLTAPDQLLLVWEQWSIVSDPGSLIQGQFETVKAAPKDFAILSGVWVFIALVSLVAYSISVFAVTMIFSGVKRYMMTQRFHLMDAAKESLHHFWGVFWAFLLAIVLLNALIIAFSLPVITLGLAEGGVGNIILLIILFAIFLVLALLVSIVSTFTAIGVVLDDYTLSQSIQAAWGVFKRHLLVTLELFIIHILIAFGLSLVLIIAISLLVVPVTIIGVLVVAAEQYLLTQYLPMVMIILLYVGFALLGAIYALFQLISWALFYKRIDDIKPYSRIASFAEITFRIQ